MSADKKQDTDEIQVLNPAYKGPSCINCRFWDTDSEEAEALIEDVGDDGYCKRYPPVPDISFIAALACASAEDKCDLGFEPSMSCKWWGFPITSFEWVCGEFQQKEEK